MMRIIFHLNVFLAAIVLQFMLPGYSCALVFQKPLTSNGWYLSQRFGIWNQDFNGYHLGEDYTVSDSSELEVYAVADGIVKHVQSHDKYGYVVIIEHLLDNNMAVCSIYGHLRKNGLTSLGAILKGQPVGYLSKDYSENGGYSFTHLHFGIRKDPYDLALDSDGKWKYKGYSSQESIKNLWYDPTNFINSNAAIDKSDLIAQIPENTSNSGNSRQYVSCLRRIIAKVLDEQNKKALLIREMTDAVDSRNARHQAIIDIVNSVLTLDNITKKSTEQLLAIITSQLTKLAFLASNKEFTDILVLQISKALPTMVSIVKNGGHAPASPAMIGKVINDSISVFSNGATAWYISEDTERINEITIAQHYILQYYNTNADEKLLAQSIGLPANSTHEDNVIQVAALAGFKRKKFGEDYNIKKLLELIKSLKLQIDKSSNECSKYATTPSNNEGSASNDNHCQNVKSEEPKPLATAIVFDKSGSMADERKIDFAREASFTYAREMKAEDQLSLSTFSNDATTPTGLEMKNKSEISPKLAEILPTVLPDGQTNIGAGLDSGLKQLCSVPSDKLKKGALLLSDGMNNVGSYIDIVSTYRDLGIPIYTVKFGKEASEKDLREIAAQTSGIYMDSDTTNITDAYRYIYAAINGDSVRIASHDPMGQNDKLSYRVDVSPDAKAFQVGTAWQGSRLKTVLTSPSGAVYTGNQLPNQADRFEAGPISQFTQISSPESGQWQIDMSWEEPPTAIERVNLFVSEHTDVYVSLYGFSPAYEPGQQVTINVHAAELDGGDNKIPLKNARVRARIQIPGPEVIRLIQAQGSKLRVYEDISQDIYREVELFDDGQHADYNANDGIFGGFFTETQLKGSYIVTAYVEGERTQGAFVRRDSRGAFHVGSLFDNEVFTSELMQYGQQLEERLKGKVVNPLGGMQSGSSTEAEIPASGSKTRSRSLMDSISN